MAHRSPAELSSSDSLRYTVLGDADHKADAQRQNHQVGGLFCDASQAQSIGLLGAAEWWPTIESEAIATTATPTAAATLGLRAPPGRRRQRAADGAEATSKPARPCAGVKKSRIPGGS